MCVRHLYIYIMAVVHTYMNFRVASLWQNIEIIGSRSKSKTRCGTQFDKWNFITIRSCFYKWFSCRDKECVIFRFIGILSISLRAWMKDFVIRWDVYFRNPYGFFVYTKRICVNLFIQTDFRIYLFFFFFGRNKQMEMGLIEPQNPGRFLVQSRAKQQRWYKLFIKLFNLQ